MPQVPDLGPRGEGWVVGQLVLLAAIGLGGFAALPTAGWSSALRTAHAGLGSVAIAIGALVAIRGVVDLGASLSPFPRPTGLNRLVETGVYRYVRHPVYAGLVLSGIGWGLITASAVAVGFSILLLLWLDLKSRREEAWLATRHAGYAAYRSRTRKFLPYVY